MRCPKCGSLEVRSSLRRGLREGLFLRILLLAPYRCKKCGTRFFSFSHLSGSRKRKKHRTLAGYLGLHGGEGRRFQRAFTIIVLFVILILVALWIVNHLSAPSAPPAIQ